MLYIVGLVCLAVGGIAGYYFGKDEERESILGDLGEEQQELIGLHKR